MNELVQNVQDPASPRYEMYYTPDEIRNLVAPSDSDYQAVLSDLKEEGFEIISESKAHLILTAKIENTHARLLKSRIQDRNPLIDSVTELNVGPKRHSNYLVSPRNNSVVPGVSQAFIKSAYRFDQVYQSGLSGKGQHIAIATYDGFHMSDINGFFLQSRISPAPRVDQVVFNGVPGVNESSAVETEMDAEFAGLIAPQAQIHIFASSRNSDAGELQMFTAILDDNRAKVVNYSWGTCETYVSSQHKADMDEVYARAIAQGVNIMVASGDNGADGCNDGTKIADWPASSPNVVAVGGTSLVISGKFLNEMAWSGSGGGISKLYPSPAYQSSLQSPFIMRSFPDIAFNADPATGQAMWTQNKTGVPHWMTVGGTSMAAPQWSGFMALLGEARLNHFKGPVGQLNPILYSISAQQIYNLLFDITEGNNGYGANAGWDAVTGLGSMQADTLLNYLVSK
jgi:kumamolisin